MLVYVTRYFRCYILDSAFNRIQAVMSPLESLKYMQDQIVWKSVVVEVVDDGNIIWDDDKDRRRQLVFLVPW